MRMKQLQQPGLLPPTLTRPIPTSLRRTAACRSVEASVASLAVGCYDYLPSTDHCLLPSIFVPAAAAASSSYLQPLPAGGRWVSDRPYMSGAACKTRAGLRDARLRRCIYMYHSDATWKLQCVVLPTIGPFSFSRTDTTDSGCSPFFQHFQFCFGSVR